MKHRVGLVGLRQAKGFIDLFNAIPDTEVTALCDIDSEILEQVGEEAGISQRFSDYTDLINSDVDIVTLSTPIQVHGTQAIEAMQSGRHVLCQYIAAMNPGEAAELVQASKESNTKYMTIETDCYERKNMVMMALAEQGALGELTNGRGHYIHDCKSLGKNPDGSLTWRGEMWMQGNGGRVSGVHTSLPLLKMFGERVEEVFAYGPGSRTYPEFSWSDRLTTVGKLASGRTLEFVFDVMSYHQVTCGYFVQGTKGYFSFDHGALVEDGKLGERKDLDALEKEFGIEPAILDRGGHRSAWQAIIENFMVSIKNDTDPSEDLDDALHVTAIGWAAEESFRTGQPAKVWRLKAKERIANC